MNPVTANAFWNELEKIALSAQALRGASNLSAKTIRQIIDAEAAREAARGGGAIINPQRWAPKTVGPEAVEMIAQSGPARTVASRPRSVAPTGTSRSAQTVTSPAPVRPAAAPVMPAASQRPPPLPMRPPPLPKTTAKPPSLPIRKPLMPEIPMPAA